jgi:hypothetical protein
VTRLTQAIRTALAAIYTLIPTVFIHDVISFALIRPHIRWSDVGCTTGDACVGIAIVVFIYAMLALPVAIVFALAGALLSGLRPRRIVLMLAWLGVCGWMLIATASGYRIGYGATWRWYEPFWELMAHPILTPALLIMGLAGFYAALRRYIP